LKKDAALGHYVDRWKQIDAGYEKAAADYPGAKSAYEKALDEWNKLHAKEYQAALAQWQQDVTKAATAKATPPPRPALPAPTPVAPQDPTGGPSAPSTLYDGMVAPLEPYAIRGAIWYQGESNASRADEYGTLFPRMIKDWRETWGEGDFPFLFVQLAGFHADDSDNWPKLREAQAKTLSLPKTGMATAVDIGLPDNIHPMDKLDVGKRLALVARHVAYGESLVYSGPTVTMVMVEGNGLRLTFSDLGGGLMIGKAPWVGPNAKVLPEDRLVGFEVAGVDGKWVPADAKIDGNTVVVSSAAVPKPIAVRYDWKAYPEGNLYNKEGLPAPPFQQKRMIVD
jgi:sialate O-acetylesterase